MSKEFGKVTLKRETQGDKKKKTVHKVHIMDDCSSVMETTGQYIKSVSADLFYNYVFGWIYTSSRRQAVTCVSFGRSSLCRT